MTTPSLASVAFFLLAFANGPVHAASLEQDEARIDALIRAEHAARQPATPAPVLATAKIPHRSDAPAPVVASVTAPPLPAQGSSEAWRSAPSADAGLGFGQLAQNVGRRVVIVTAGEKVHRGIVQAADAAQVILRVKLSGGNAATYSLRRNQVTRIDLR